MTVKSTAQEIYSQSYIHGIADIVGNVRWRRAFWLVAFLTALTLGIYSCGVLIKEYVDGKTSVAVDMKPFTFIDVPEVVVCPNNRFDGAKITQLIEAFNAEQAGRSAEFGIKEARMLSALFVSQDLMDNLDTLTEFKELEADAITVAKSLDKLVGDLNWNLLDFIENVTFNCNDMIQFCHVDLGKVYGKQACCPNGGSIFPQGYCSVVRAENQSMIGPLAGNMLELEVPRQLTAPLDTLGRLPVDGVAIGLLTPKTNFTLDFMHIPRSYHATIELKQIQATWLNTRKRPCKKHVQNLDVCVYRCVIEGIMERGDPAHGCDKCLPLQLIPLIKSDKPICTAEQMYNCLVSTTLNKGLAGFNRTLTSECKMKSCSLSCNHEYYEKSISYNKLMNTDGLNMDYMVTIQVAHKTLEVEYRSESYVMDFFSLIANMGGTIGLWVGASVIGFIQFITLSAKYYKVTKGKDT